MQRTPRPPRALLPLAIVATTTLLPTPAARATPDLRFDVVTFNATPEGYPDHMNQTLFNDLNFTTLNGHSIAMGSDAHRPELTAAGNVLSAYYNSWTNIYNGQPVDAKDGFAAADTINAYANSFTTNGPRPDWVVLNELSGSLWPNTTSKGDTYRQWIVDCVTRLHDTYGYNVIAYSPFPKPGAHADTWQALASKAYVAVENYLSGAEVKAQNFSLPWVQSQYAASITAYGNLGVPKSRLFLGEEFASTTAGTGYGRAGVSTADWTATIRVRSQAIYNLDFAGFIGYAWGKNAMGLSDADLLAAEDAYRSTLVLRSEQPHWLAPAGGSWSARNNWIAYDTVPTAPGDAATFDKTLTAPSATITLDGDHTVGSLTFNTPHPLTLTPGTGGTLTLATTDSSPPSITVLQGSPTIAAPLTFSSPATLTIAPGAHLDITTNTLLLNASGVVASATMSQLRQYLHDNQLLSSTAQADPQHLLTLGYLLDPTTNTITVKTATLGDANLDGVVNADDYALLDRGFAKHLTGWSNGDFNYDGLVDQNDYLLIDTTLGQAQGFSPGFLAQRESQFGAPYVSQLLASVPEPSLALFAACGLALPYLHRRR